MSTPEKNRKIGLVALAALVAVFFAVGAVAHGQDPQDSGPSTGWWGTGMGGMGGHMGGGMHSGMGSMGSHADHDHSQHADGDHTHGDHEGDPDSCHGGSGEGSDDRHDKGNNTRGGRMFSSLPPLGG